MRQLLIAVAALTMYAAHPVWSPVDESECRLRMMADSSEITLQLREGRSPVHAEVKLEWLDERDTILSTGQKKFLIDLKGGRVTVPLPIGWSRFGGKKRNDFFWNRIGYRVTAADGQVARGIISISALKSNLFRIQIDQPRLAPDSEGYKLVIRAVHPITEQALANVDLSAQLLSGTASAIDCGKAVSDASGFAAFDVPAAPRRIADARIAVKGDAQGYIQKAELGLEINLEGEIRVSTDRELYQPGQPLHIRAILLNSRGRALAGSPAKVRVIDSRSASLFTTTVRSSRFGIVAADWSIPDNAALGRYHVVVSATDAEDVSDGSATFDISRYDLPTFDVRVKADRPFYLPGQTPVFEVVARYTHGQPVQSGSVQITRVTRSCRNPDATRADAGERVESPLRSGGTATLTMAVPPLCAEVQYLATVTDAASGRSESRPITVRVSERPIWIDIVRDEGLSTALARTFYVLTRYADGSPAECEVQIHQTRMGARTDRLLRTVRTGKGGVAEVRDFQLLAAAGSGVARLHFRAADRTGQTGEANRDYSEMDAPGITVQTDKAIYRPGDPIVARISSTEPAETVQVVVSADYRLLDWFTVQLVNGKAEITVPFRPDFLEAVEVQVQRQDVGLEELAEGSQSAFDVLRVYYPRRPPIRVDIQPTQRTYRPGDEAVLHVRVSAADGSPVEAALGLAAIDEASEQRAQTRPPTYVWRRGNSEEIEGVDLLEGNSGEAQILAAATLNQGSGERWVFIPYMYETARLGSIYAPALDKRLSRFRESWRRCTRAGDCPMDEGQLRGYMSANGWNPAGIFDPWGTLLRPVFTIQREQRRLELISAGPDKRFATADDQKALFESWRYFDTTAAMIRSALATARFPQSPTEFDSLLRTARIPEARVLDPWGRRYSVVFAAKNIRLAGGAAEPGARRVVQVPLIILISAGPDGKGGTGDDFTVATFAAAEQDELSAAASAPGARRTLNSRAGIQGRVVAPSGAVVHGALVRVSAAGKKSVFEVSTDANGEYMLFNIPAGMYDFTVESRGFQVYVARRVAVRAGMVAQVTASLQVASLLEQIEVTEQPPEAQTTMAMIISPSYKRAPAPPPPPGGRVREYFPETMLWLPLLETDRNGMAEVKFRTADSITTWKVAATGSTVDGLIASRDDRIRTFQPFFVELDPPSVLTQGDEISLPAIVRNYSDQRQQVSLTMEQAPWFRLADQADRAVQVEPGGTAIETFRVSMLAAIDKGRQEISARSDQQSDAVRRWIQVRPDGRQVTVVRNHLFEKESTVSVVLPPEMLPGSARATLRLYPDLLSHLVGSPEEMLQKPHGCAEQTISSTLPNLLLLRHAANGGKIEAQLRQSALANLQKGYDRLLGYRSQTGGFTYFESGDPDPALTAYALDFLIAAKRFISVDQSSIRSAALWLTEQLPRTTGRHRAYLLRALAEYSLEGGASPVGVREGFRTGGNDPYVLSQEVLFRLALHENEAARSALQALAALAQDDHDSVSWSNGSATPFHGWGAAGRAETTALAMRAIIAAQQAGISLPTTAGLIHGGLLYLLSAKDESGLWHSTQASIRVLDVLMMAAQASGGEGTVEVSVNGNALRTDAKSSDLSRYLEAGSNEFRFATRGGSLGMAQLVTTYYVPWDASTDASGPLRLRVGFSKTNPRIGEAVTASVSARRIASDSSGMMIAEIGLPPAADVDRASLEAAVGNRTSLWRYEVLPDKVVAYLWPSVGGEAQFEFTFRLRYAMSAKAAASTLYDYYNPAARVTAAPQRFTVDAR